MAGYNSERGEVPLTVGGVDLVVACEMGKLAELSSRLACQSFQELYLRLAGGEVATVMAAIELMTVKGDWGAALKALSVRDIGACSKAFKDMLLHSAGKSRARGKAKAAGATKASPGGSGKSSPSAGSDGDPPSSGA